jgi:alpha-L-rhamnosidase
MLEQGATTLWELWQNKTGPAMNSHNHPMFGSIGAWFYRALGGIEHDPAQRGYRRIRIAPQAPRDLRWVSASIQTVRGPVVSSWSRGEDSLRLEVTVPVGSEAQIHLPKLNFRNVTVQESGHAVWTGGAYRPGAPGITSATETRGAIVVEAGSGAYRFEVREN